MNIVNVFIKKKKKKNVQSHFPKCLENWSKSTCEVRVSPKNQTICEFNKPQSLTFSSQSLSEIQSWTVTECKSVCVCVFVCAHFHVTQTQYNPLSTLSTNVNKENLKFLFYFHNIHGIKKRLIACLYNLLNIVQKSYTTIQKTVEHITLVKYQSKERYHISDNTENYLFPLIRAILSDLFWQNVTVRLHTLVSIAMKTIQACGHCFLIFLITKPQQ